MNRCEKCKYYDYDHVYDDEVQDEYKMDICEENHDEYLDSEEDCPYFKKYKEKKYKEEYTKCDTCEHLSECMEKYETIEVTITGDNQRHYICGAGSECKK